MDPFKTTPHTVAHSGKPLAMFNPALLLNPKSAKTSPAAQTAVPTTTRGASVPTPSHVSAPQFTFASADGSYANDTSDSHSTTSQASMLERMHNVEERSQRAPKRVKRSQSPATSASKSNNRGGTGIISSHIKEIQKQHASARVPPRDAVNAIKAEIESSLPTVSEGPGPGPTAAAEDVVDLTEDALGAEMLDLTAEPENGERSFYVVNGRKIYINKNDPNEREVCYGRIEGARIVCFHVPDPGKLISARGEWPPMAVKLQRGVTSSFIIKAIDPANKDFGNLDPRTSYALRQFLDGPFRVRMEAKTDIRPKKNFESPGQPCSEHIVVHINLFGPFKFAVDPIGKSLSQKQVWLRNPKTIGHNVEVFNPHTHDHQLSRMAQKAAQKTMSNLGSANPGFRTRTVEEAQVEVQSMFDDIEKNKDLPSMDPDANIESEMLKHQKQALAWMNQREQPIFYEPGKIQTGSLWRCSMKNGQRVYHNVVTGHEIRERPRDCFGGILADMMGLGKTLSMLSLLSYTRMEALAFETESPTVDHPSKGIPLRNMRSTLLVCPVSVITNWEDQITEHVREGGLTYYPYHGSTRRRSLEFLSQFDVIITSYNIVKSEIYPSTRSHNSNGQVAPLAGANFFRVVLDEAHTIRTQSTQQFLACNEINASRRWALTATPVQNRLDDLGALVRFLRVSPFDDQRVFNQSILAPFKLADPEALKHLRLLVSSITLRRQKTIIDLKPRKDETVTLKFRPEEQTLYSFFAADATRRLADMTSGIRAGLKTKFGGKAYMNILRSILCLRQISAHGKDMLRDEDMQLIEGRSTGSAINVDEEDTRPALGEHQAYSVFEILKETDQTVCVKCARSINTTLPDLPEDEDETLCTMLPCYQLVCNECAKDIRKQTKRLLEQGEERMVCPFCEVPWRIVLVDITANGITRADRRNEDLKKEPRKAKMLFRYEGPSTKTTMLISRLHDAAVESIPLMEAGEMPIKSVVFSAWTTHLDLMSIALDRENIEYTMMVGSMSRKQRRQSIEEFTTSKTCNVFLVTIGTGGVGLNLTAANKVYLMDIGFNPMAEQQAIDRVHRLGQTREVTFTRFLMEKSIEEKILELQMKKMDLADLSMQRGKTDKAEAVRARLEQLKALFK